MKKKKNLCSFCWAQLNPLFLISNESSDYASDTFTMLGTFVLWVFFPSLNAALVPASAQARTALNTVLALAGGTTFAFCASRLFHQKRFHMIDVQNATIAAGVAISSSASVRGK